MKQKVLEILLLLYLFAFAGSDVAPMLLSQIRAIHASRRAEQKIGVNPDRNSREALQDFLRSFSLNSHNGSTYTYLELLWPELGWFDSSIQAIRLKVANNRMELSENAVSQLIAQQVTIQEIREVFANGQQVIGYPSRFSHRLVCGLTQRQRPIGIKCSDANRQIVKIMAINEIDPELWNDNFTTRIDTINDQ